MPRKGFGAIRDLHLREIIELQEEQVRLLTSLLEKSEQVIE